MATATGIVGEFLDLKAESSADVLAMQCGDFYEFFDDDAELVARELDLSISQKSSGGEAYPMAGVPVNDLTPYLRTLVESGYRVAVADQFEVNDGFEREVVRVASPGTLVETTADAAILGAIDRADAGSYGLAIVDLTTGHCHASRFEGADASDRLLSELYRFDPDELLIGPGLESDAIATTVRDRTGAVVTDVAGDMFAPGAATARTTAQFGETVLESLGLDTEDRAAVRPLGAALAYVDESGVGMEGALTRLQPIAAAEHVRLDMTTQRTLELTEPLLAEGTSVLSVVDGTVTTAGSRALRARLTRPLRERDRLTTRLDRIDALVTQPLARESMRDTLRSTADLERLAGRLSRGSVDARALLTLGRTLGTIPTIADCIKEDETVAASPLSNDLESLPRDRLADVRGEIESAIHPDPPSNLTEGSLIRRGYDPELDELIDRHESALEWVDSLAERERDALGITHLQVDRNRTDGYYIQVGNSETDAVPDRYEQVKSLKNSVRYTTPALQEREQEIVRVEEARFELEYELFSEVRDRIAGAVPEIQAAGQFLARLDADLALAHHAVEQGWTRPELGEPGAAIGIEAGRHPVVETTTEFVPNDVAFDADDRLRLVTGPNMSGKSTYLRQTALIVLLAQIGSFVPATAARIGLVDGIFTRVGALDELSQGRSTFMVEMQELANILHAATDESLVILDEVGRGTATYDGISIAWAATEYLHNEIGAVGLFATHYHELTELADRLPAARNVHVAVEESAGEVTFLRTVSDGATDRSYGIYVAGLAGVPTPVQERATAVLDRLRSDRSIEAKGSGTVQAVFDLDGKTDTDEPAVSEAEVDVLASLRELSVEDTPPIELLTLMAGWQDKLDDR